MACESTQPACCSRKCSEEPASRTVGLKSCQPRPGSHASSACEVLRQCVCWTGALSEVQPAACMPFTNSCSRRLCVVRRAAASGADHVSTAHLGCRRSMLVRASELKELIRFGGKSGRAVEFGGRSELLLPSQRLRSLLQPVCTRSSSLSLKLGRLRPNKLLDTFLQLHALELRLQLLQRVALVGLGLLTGSVPPHSLPVRSRVAQPRTAAVPARRCACLLRARCRSLTSACLASVVSG